MKKILGDKEFVIGKPLDWKDLEDRVYKFFKIINDTTEHNKKLSNIKGVTHKTDVYFKEFPTVNGKYLFDVMIECKNWKSNLPQSTVSSFVNFCSEFGAARGIVLCTSDFQKGCEALVIDKPVLLLTLEEFIDSFFHQWFYKCCTQVFNKLSSYQSLRGYIGSEFYKAKYCLEKEAKLLNYISLLSDSTDEISTMQFYADNLNIDKISFKVFLDPNLKTGKATFSLNPYQCNSVLEYFEKLFEIISDADDFIATEIEK